MAFSVTAIDINPARRTNYVQLINNAISAVAFFRIE